MQVQSASQLFSRKLLSYSNRATIQSDRAGSPHHSMGLRTFTLVRLREACHNLHGPQALGVNLSSKPPARIQRWALRLQPYQITVKYRRGEVNPADYLSRHPTKREAKTSQQQKVAEEYVSYLATTSTPKDLKIKDIEEATQSDATLKAVAEALATGTTWSNIAVSMSKSFAS